MRLVFNANSCKCPLRRGQGLERRILRGLPRETMLRSAVFEMRGIARTYSKPRTDTDPPSSLTFDWFSVGQPVNPMHLYVSTLSRKP